MTNITLKAKGMHCSSCEMLIQDALEELDGIKSSKADHNTGSVIVNFDESKTTPDSIKAVISKEGYEVE